jgi:hypothetical protein
LWYKFFTVSYLIFNAILLEVWTTSVNLDDIAFTIIIGDIIHIIQDVQTLYILKGSKRISVFLIADMFLHIFLHFDSISFSLPLFWVHSGYFEYKNFSGEFCGI